MPMKTRIILLLACAVAAMSCSKSEISAVPNMGNLPPFLVKFDINGDGHLDLGEMSAVRSIDCSGQNIGSLDWVSAFPNLDTLICSRNPLQVVPPEIIAKLKYLDCSHDSIWELNLSRSSLKTVLCNPMTDSSGNNVLEYIYIARNQQFDRLDAPSETMVIAIPTE